MAYQVYWGQGSAKWPVADGYYRTKKEATTRASLMRQRDMSGSKYAVKKVADPPGGDSYFRDNPRRGGHRRRSSNPRTLAEVKQILYRMQIGKGMAPQAAMNWAERNKEIYHRATIAADAHAAGATKEVALRKAFGKKGLREIQAGRAGSPKSMVRNPSHTQSFMDARTAEDFVHTLRKRGLTVSISPSSGSRHTVKWWTPDKAINPASRISNRLTPVRFTIKGKTVTGKAKLVDGKVKIFVTPQVARKVNPELKEYRVILHNKDAPRGVTAVVYATTAGQASRMARKRKAEFVPSDPKKWKVFSVKRETGTR